MHPIWFVAVISAFVVSSDGYSKGAPDTACIDMVPQHGTLAKTTEAPYDVKVSTVKISPGGKVQVTIVPHNGGTFKGFFIQARVGNTPVGHFDEATDTNLVDCREGVKIGITHSNSKEKRTVVVTWNAPKGLSEHVKFWATIVKEGDTFWVGHKSDLVAVGKN